MGAPRQVAKILGFRPALATGSPPSTTVQTSGSATSWPDHTFVSLIAQEEFDCVTILIKATSVDEVSASSKEIEMLLGALYDGLASH